MKQRTLFSKRITYALMVAMLITACHRKTIPEGNLGGTGAVHTETGLASFYSDKLNGHATASGEVYSSSKKTAAHKKLPFGTLVKVTNTVNNKSVIVRVNDRGPFVAGRIIDLSKAAAIAIGMVGKGIVKVTILYRK